MAISNKLIIVFTFFYLAVVIYLFLFLTVPEIQNTIIQSREQIALLTEGNNYFFAIFLSLFICFIGNASIGFPVPYPFILFSFSQSIFIKYTFIGLTFQEVLLNGYFWSEIIGIAIAGGLGSAIGEFLSIVVGIGAKKIAEKTSSKTLENVRGFGRLVLEHPRSMYFYIFIAAALPIPDDPLWIALGMSKRKINYIKCLIWGWLGKNVTTIFYVALPIFIIFGFSVTGIELNDVASVITESIMLLVTLSMMLFILSFNWDKFIDQRQTKKQS
ncbi:MAG: hypothetical protein EU533_04700 [Promethearchaeota archaeon]|nr:MAG: hypothetical protein EU533_04700 [Candidatus Lokiarchaeota archaeon]